jgi:hypothetical protein
MTIRWIAGLAAVLILPACGGDSGKPFANSQERDPAGSSGQPATIRIIRPDSGATASEGSSVTIEAEVTDPNASLDRVDFYDNNRRVGSASSPPYVLSYGRLKPGTHELCAVGVDFDGNVVSSPPVTLFVVRGKDEDQDDGHEHGHGPKH